MILIEKGLRRYRNDRRVLFGIHDEFKEGGRIAHDADGLASFERDREIPSLGFAGIEDLRRGDMECLRVAAQLDRTDPFHQMLSAERDHVRQRFLLKGLVQIVEIRIVIFRERLIIDSAAHEDDGIQYPLRPECTGDVHVGLLRDLRLIDQEDVIGIGHAVELVRIAVAVDDEALGPQAVDAVGFPLEQPLRVPAVRDVVIKNGDAHLDSLPSEDLYRKRNCRLDRHSRTKHATHTKRMSGMPITKRHFFVL